MSLRVKRPLMAAVLSMALPSVALPKEHPRIRYTEAFVKASCDLAKLDPLETSKPESAAKWLERREELKSILDAPYPPELMNYAPPPFEYAAHLQAGIPCPGPSTGPTSKLPKTFRCRLDRVLFRDTDARKSFQAKAALLRFGFLYDDVDKRKLEDRPRPLKEDAPRLVGEISVQGTMDGQTYIVAREWTGGSPVEALASVALKDATPEWRRTTPTTELPMVTFENAHMFVFDLRNDTPGARAAVGGPLKDFTFIPAGCRA